MSDSLRKTLEGLRRDKRREENQNNLKEVAQICNVIGELYTRHGRHEDALEEHKTELTLSEALQDTLGSAIASRKIGESYCQLGDYKEALLHQNKHLQLAKQSCSLTEEQRAVATIGRTYLCQAETVKGEDMRRCLSEAENAFRKGLELCEHLRHDLSVKDYMEMRARLLLNLGLVFDNRDNHKKCIEYIKQAIYISEKHKLNEDLYRGRFSLAGIYQKNSNLAEALRCVDSALKCAQKMGDKEYEIEALTLKAQCFVQIGDFVAGKKCLKAAYKSGSAVESTRLSVKKQLRLVLMLCTTDEELAECEENDEGTRLSLYEKLADTLASLNAFQEALSYYEKMLNCAQKLEKDCFALAPIYVSLAQTCSDLKQYGKAVQFYQKELSCSQLDAEQKCRTYLNIAEAQENSSNESYDTLVESYRLAYEFAKQAKHKQLQVTCLKSLTLVQEYHKMMEDREKTMNMLTRLRSKYNIFTDDEFSDEEDTSQQWNDSNGEISFSDSDISDEESTAAAVLRKGHRTTKVKLNEKGESPLHRACIDGNMKKVHQLLRQGHPVNPRDYCGWLPIHEAANHDHCDIVSYLIDHGAHFNDRGGEKCGGITPLHDAANCGNTDVVRLLVERGAQVYCKDDEGMTPLDALVQYRRRSQDDLERQTTIDIKAVEKLLTSKMTNFPSDLDVLPDNEDLSDTHELPSISLHRGHKEGISMNNRAGDNSSADEADSENKAFLADEDDMPAGASSATATYRQAMSLVGSAASRISTQKIISDIPECAIEKPALVCESEAVNDDWLVEDVQPSKRKRLDVRGVFTASRRQVSATNKTTKKTTNLDLPESDNLEIVDSHSDSVTDSRHVTSHRSTTKRKRSTQLKMTDFNKVTPDGKNLIIHPIVPSDLEAQATVNISNNIRIKVRIKDTLLLIPVTQGDANKTIGWLSQTASQRYFAMSGLNPVLHLATQDGAVLAENDQVTMVLTSDEEVTGIVETWNLPPLADRYIQTCQSRDGVIYKNIRACLTHCESELVLCLGRLSMNSQCVSPVFSALQYQSSLKTLNLQGNEMGNEGMKCLSVSLPTLTSLSALNLSCNNISHEGMKHMTNIFDTAKTCLQSLQHLNLSFNPLGDTSAVFIIKLIVQCNSLYDLDLECCDLTTRFFQSHRLPLAEACQERYLTKLNVAGNQLGSTGVELLLRSVGGSSLQTLDLSGVINKDETSQLCHHLQTYLTQTNCCLERLSLSGCWLSYQGYTEWASCFAASTTLTKLDLSGNIQLKNRDITRLLIGLGKSYSKIDALCIDGCGICSPLGSAFIDAFSEKLTHSIPIYDISLTCQDMDQTDVQSLHNIWRSVHGNRSICIVHTNYVHLCVSDN